MVYIFIEDQKPKFRYIIEASDDYFTSNATENLFNNKCIILQNTTTQQGLGTFGSMELLCYFAF